MGNEESRPVGANAEPSWVQPASPGHEGGRPQSSPARNGSRSVSASGAADPSRRLSHNGAGASSKKERSPPAPSKPGWMRPSQQRPVHLNLDVRKAVERQYTFKPRSSSPGRGEGPTPRASQSGTPPEPDLSKEAADKLEANKRDLMKKITSHIKNASLRDLALQPAKNHRVKDLPVPQEHKRNWLGKLTKSKADTLLKMADKVKNTPYLEPMSQEAVGDRVENTMGDQYEQFSGFQGAIHDIMATGIPEEMLDEFFFDEEQEKALTTYQKWQIIRHAAEQVLAVYANRSNSAWIEDHKWVEPSVIDTTAVAASMYANSVDTALQTGQIALLFIDDGRLSELGNEEASPLVCTDLWQAIKELAPHKVPSEKRLEHLSVAGRHLLHAAVSVEMWYGQHALKQLKVVLAVDCDVEYYIVNELQQWSFFGLSHRNVVILPLPRFHGFAQDVRSGHLAHVKGSPRLMLGTGYAMFLLNSPASRSRSRLSCCYLISAVS